MTRQAPVKIERSHDAAMVVTAILADYFYSGTGPLEGRLTAIQAHAMSELLFAMEKSETVSPILLGPGFSDRLRIAEGNVLAQIEGHEPPAQS